MKALVGPSPQPKTLGLARALQQDDRQGHSCRTAFQVCFKAFYFYFLFYKTKSTLIICKSYEDREKW